MPSFAQYFLPSSLRLSEDCYFFATTRGQRAEIRQGCRARRDVSLIETRKLNDVEPFGYLRTTPEANAPINSSEDLSPKCQISERVARCSVLAVVLEGEEQGFACAAFCTMARRSGSSPDYRLQDGPLPGSFAAAIPAPEAGADRFWPGSGSTETDGE